MAKRTNDDKRMQCIKRLGGQNRLDIGVVHAKNIVTKWTMDANRTVRVSVSYATKIRKTEMRSE